MTEVQPPKLFISYSWSNPKHKAWVLELATKLAENGVHPILDEWDLKPGGDAYRFMERMVTDDTIRKVILICDKVYAEKADARAGGVGTEAQILTPELYGKGEESKFVAIISETDDNGKPNLPAFYRSRIYIDLSNEASYVEEFEKLIRWIHDKPRHQRPPIGPRPAYLDEERTGIRLGTSVALGRCEDAIRNSKSYAMPALREYFDILVKELENFRIAQSSGDQEVFDEKVIQNIEDFVFYRNETISVFSTIARYHDEDDSREIVHRFFESLVPYTRRPPSVMQFGEGDWDNYRIIVHELLLYYLAVQIKFEKFSTVEKFLEQPFLVGRHPDFGQAEMSPFTVFCFSASTLAHRARRLRKELTGFYSSILRQRSGGTNIQFSNLMAADLIMFLRAQLLYDSDGLWWPFTLESLKYRSESPEILVRASSKRYFDRIKGMFGISDKVQLEEAVRTTESQPHFYRTMFSRTSLGQFMRLEDLATRP